MVPKALARSLRTKSVNAVLKSIPAEFTLGTGHVTFFYDKGAYLYSRFEKLKHELDVRCINYNQESIFDPDGVMQQNPFYGWYEPTASALEIIRERIQSRINEKPDWYRYTGLGKDPRFSSESV
jgi:deoxyribonuclease (pyrimidine dimer)